MYVELDIAAVEAVLAFLDNYMYNIYWVQRDVNMSRMSETRSLAPFGGRMR